MSYISIKNNAKANPERCKAKLCFGLKYGGMVM